MNKTLVLLAAAAGVAFAAPSFAEEKVKVDTKTHVEKDAKGNYEAKKTVKATDAAGTTTKSEAKTEVDVDSNKTTTTTESKEMTDPKGLGNKTSAKTKEEVVSKADGEVTKEVKKTVDGKTVEHTKEKLAPAAGEAEKH